MRAAAAMLVACYNAAMGNKFLILATLVLLAMGAMLVGAIILTILRAALS